MLTELVDVRIKYLGVEADSNEGNLIFLLWFECIENVSVYSILNIISGMCGRMNNFEKSLEIRETVIIFFCWKN